MSGKSSEEPQLETNSNNSSFDKSNESLVNNGFGRGRRRKRKVARDSDGGDDDKSVDRSDDNSSVSSSIRRKRNENVDDAVSLDTEIGRGRGVVRLIRLKDTSSLLAACDIKEEKKDEESMSLSENDTSPTNTEIRKEKKRRGRPPRNISATSSPQIPKPKKKVISNKVIDEVKSVSSSSSVGDKPNVPQKRGRGRPRKSDVVSTTPSVLTFGNNFFNEKQSTSTGRISMPSTSSGLESERKRRIIKPKRFDSYESFEFMDVNEKESASPNNSSRGNDDEEEGGDEDDDDEDENEKQDDENESAAATKPRRRGRRKPKTVLVARLDKEMVKCGVCQESMIMKEYKMKHMDKHNFLCWIEGDPPVDPNNENDIIAAVCKARRIKKKFFTGLKCPKCGARKKSGVGYYSHIQTCGMTMSEREATKIACPTCGRVMLPSSLKVHMTNEHKNLESKTIVNKEAELVEGVPLAKRAAASRAESKLEKFMADELDDIGIRVKKTIPLKRFYRQTQSKLFPNAHVRWKLELKEHNYVKCFIPGCSFTAHDLKEIRVHFYNCPFAVRVFICKLCDAQAKTDHDIQTHLLTSHKDSLTGDSDFQVKSVPESEDETEYNSLYFGLRESVVELPKPTAEKPSFILQSVHKRGLSFYADILDKTYKRVVENTTSQPLFQEFVAPFDDALTEIESEEFIPVASSSIRFSSEFGNWQKLGRFKSCTFGETKLLFTGGPIWAMAWCPVPLEETRQYLAVGCHPDMNMVHTQASTHSYSSLIQIWDCGDLNNSNSDYLDNVPKLKLGLAHTNGAVWSLEWCPSGCYQPSCGRLGLLAAGFSNGKALIFSIPSRPTDVQRLPIFKFKPVLELELMSEEPAQCTRLAWTKDSPFNILACGYSDGLIALFDLTSQSPLLRSCNTLYPFHMFQPHSKSITGLQFIPRANSNYLLTASSDRDIKFWNLSDTSGPVSVSQLYRMITVTDVVWLNNWLCAASTYDDALGYGLMNISLNGYRDYMYGQPAPIMSQNSLHWSISFNDWTNGISTSSDAGEVVVMNFRHLYFVDDKKSKLRVKKYLTTTDLRKLDGNDTDPLLKLKAPESYDEAAEEYGLVLKCGTTVEYPSSKRDEPERHFYQIKSINKVTWNQNGRSFLFLAAGYQCGFVQIFRDHSVDEARVLFDDFYKKLLKAKRE